MANPLEALQDAAKGLVVNTVEWGFSLREKYERQAGAGKIDPVLNSLPLDVLRRAAYNSRFDILFQSPDKLPYVTPVKTLKTVISKLAFLMFPKGTTFAVAANQEANALLQKVIAETKFQLKTEDIVVEAALMGYCGLRTVYDDRAGRWIYEVKPKEYLVIETLEGIQDEYIAIGLEWPIDGTDGKRYWKKERWTKDEYQWWPAKLETLEGKPKFLPEEMISEPNHYGEIPYTIVPHLYESGCQGQAIVNEEEILSVKALIRLRHKRHFGHQKYMDPNPIRKNHANPGEPLNLGIGTVVDLVQADENMPVDLSLLEYQGMPDSVKEEMYDHIRDLYEAAGLKAPPMDEAFKPGTDSSGIALRLMDRDDADTITTLRDNGYSQVLRHFEKILRMGATLGLPEYSVIRPEDPETWTVTASYPDFFPPTDQDIALKLANWKQSYLPAKRLALYIAGLYGIEDQAEIDEIERSIIDEREALKPQPLEGRGYG